MKYYKLYTYGCQMNVHESEKIAGILRRVGYQEESTLEDADIIVFNTCCIRENAENHAFGNIGALKQLKRKKDVIIAVGGCMTQQKGFAEKLHEKGCPEVVIHDLARTDMAEAVEDAFRYSKLVLATTTYNADIFPFMKEFIDHLTERNFSNRTVAFI